MNNISEFHITFLIVIYSEISESYIKFNLVIYDIHVTGLILNDL